MKPYYRWTATKLDQGGKWHPIFANEKSKIARIAHRGLAKRSWFWSMSELGKSEGSKAIPGASHIVKYSSPAMIGYIKQNKLQYITRALPAGWEATIAARVTNKIMKQAALKLEKLWGRAMMRIRTAA
jgi:hypothetical protein